MVRTRLVYEFKKTKNEKGLEKKSAIKSPNIRNLFRQRSGYFNDFTLIYPGKNLVDFRGFDSTNHLHAFLKCILKCMLKCMLKCIFTCI